MTLLVTLEVKFRWLGITFGKVGPLRFRFPVPVAAVLFAESIRDGLEFNDRGVKLSAEMMAEE